MGYYRIAITVEVLEAVANDQAGAELLAKVIAWLHEQHVYTGRVALELQPPPHY